jgi:hypothetical protein
MCVDGWTDAGVKARHFNMFSNTQEGEIKYITVGRRQFCSLSLTSQRKCSIQFDV